MKKIIFLFVFFFSFVSVFGQTEKIEIPVEINVPSEIAGNKTFLKKVLSSQEAVRDTLYKEVPWKFYKEKYVAEAKFFPDERKVILSEYKKAGFLYFSKGKIFISLLLLIVLFSITFFDFSREDRLSSHFYILDVALAFWIVKTILEQDVILLVFLIGVSFAVYSGMWLGNRSKKRRKEKNSEAIATE